MIDSNMAGLRAVARKLGLGASTISEWTKILELTPPMQMAVEKGQIYYKDALNVAYLKLGEIKEKELAQAADTGGRDAFIDGLAKAQTGHEKRGIPKGKYDVWRITWERRGQDKSKYENIEQQAKVRNMEVPEYVKLVLTDKKTLMEYAKSLP